MVPLLALLKVAGRRMRVNNSLVASLFLSALLFIARGNDIDIGNSRKSVPQT